jgi:hypothetical protein
VLAVYVLSGAPLEVAIARTIADPENMRLTFPMNKGLPNIETRTYWAYWILCEDEWWLQLETEEMKIPGQRQQQC